MGEFLAAPPPQQLRPLSSGEGEQTAVGRAGARGRLTEAAAATQTFNAWMGRGEGSCWTPDGSRTTERFPLGAPAAHRWSGPSSSVVKMQTWFFTYLENPSNICLSEKVPGVISQIRIRRPPTLVMRLISRICESKDKSLAHTFNSL